MPLTNNQITEFAKRAKMAGLSDTQIQQEIEKKAREMSGSSGMIQNVTQRPPVTPQNPATSSTMDSSQPSGSNFAVDFVKGLVQPAVEYGKLVGEGVYQSGRFVFDPVFRKAVMGEKLTPEENKKLGEQKAMLFFSDQEGEEKFGDVGKGAMTAAKTAAGMSSYFIPFGKGTSLATKVFLPGAATGALSEFSREGSTATSVVEAGAMGAGTAGAVHGAGQVFSYVKNLFRGQGANVAERTYAQAFNVPRASAQRLGIKPLETSKKMLDYQISGSADDILKSSETVTKNLTSAVHEAVAKSKNPINYVDDLIDVDKMIDKMGGLDTNAKSSLKDTLRNYFSGREPLTPDSISAADTLDIIRELQQEGMVAHLAEKRSGDLVAGQTADAFFGLASALSDKLNESVGKVGIEKVISQELMDTMKSVSPKLADELAKVKTVSALRSLQKPFVDAAKMIAFSEDAAAAGGQQLATRAFAAVGGGVMAGPVGAALGAIFGPTAQAGLEAIRPAVMTKIATAMRGMSQSATKKLGVEVPKAGQMITQENIERLVALTPSIMKERGLTDQEIDQVSQIQQMVTTEAGAGATSPKSPVNQPNAMNPFGGLTKRQVQALALSKGASASDIKEIGEMYDLMAADPNVIDEDTQKTADTLRTEYFKRTNENSFIEVSNSFDKVKGTSETAAGDVSLIFAFMKMLDPGSVVREGEFATAEQTAGVPEQIVQQYNKAIKGDRLSPQQRQAYKNEAARVFQTYQTRQANIDSYYQGLAQKYGIDPSLLGVGLYR